MTIIQMAKKVVPFGWFRGVKSISFIRNPNSQQAGLSIGNRVLIDSAKVDKLASGLADTRSQASDIAKAIKLWLIFHELRHSYQWNNNLRYSEKDANKWASILWARHCRSRGIKPIKISVT